MATQRMERFTSTFENLLAALADAVKQLGEGGQQQPWARTRVEEAKQEFVSSCDIMCLQLKQAIEVIRQELAQALPASSGGATEASLDSDQVRHVLAAAEQFAAQLRSGGAGGGGQAQQLLPPGAAGGTGAGQALAAAAAPAAVKEEPAPFPAAHLGYMHAGL